MKILVQADGIQLTPENKEDRRILNTLKVIDAIKNA